MKTVECNGVGSTLVESIAKWFKRAVPTPTDKNRCVQLGCYYEEVAETMLAADSNDATGEELQITATSYKTAELDTIMAFTYVEHPADFLDGLCDTIVTAIGVAHMYGFDIIGALNEVNRSNWSKFDANGNPVFDANGKIAKNPETFSKADVSPFIGSGS